MSRRTSIFETTCFLFIINCLISLNCFAQNLNQIYFEHYSPDRGLSQGSGYVSAQFDDFMWFGTQDGLNRFDGYDFKVYKSDRINAGFTQALLNDKRGHLWVGTSKGLHIYDPRTDSFRNFNQFLRQNNLLQSASIRLLMMDKLMNIWILTDVNGAFYYDFKSRKLRNYPEFSNRLIDINEENNGNIFVATDNDIFKLDNNRQNFIPLNLKEVLGLSKKATFRSVLADVQDQIWIGTYENGLYLMQDKGGNLNLKKHFGKADAPSGISSNEITRLMQDSKGRIWIGTRTGGISVYNPADQKFIHVMHQENEPLSLAGNFILSFSEDRQNNIWVGTSGRGFEKYDLRKYQFGLIRKDEKKPENSLSDNMVFKIYGHENYLYFGTQSGGLTRFDPLTNQYKIYKSNPDNPKGLLHNEVYDISADKADNLWLALGKGLCKFDPKTQLFESYFQDNQEELVYLYAVKVLKNDEVWTGGQRGLYRFDLKQKKWKNWDDIPALKAISKYIIRLIHEDLAGDIWIGTIGQGILKYSFKTQKVTRFDQLNGIECANIRAVFEDKDTFWFGSDCGVYEFDKRKNAVTNHFSDVNGLPNNVVYAILKDKGNRLWFSTNKGLTVFNPQKNSFKNYNASDGLQANEFNTNCSFLAKTGMMYFGGVNGISFFKPEYLTSNNFIAPVKITSLKVMDRVFTGSLALPYVKTIDLPYDQNYISFEFSAFNFSNSESNSYRYRLQELDKNWINSKNRRNANYTNLPPGNYIFRVKGANNDGIENPQEAAIQILIHPPFWQTIWFRAILVLLFLGIIYLIYRHKINSIRKEEQQKSEIRRIRTEAEMAVMRAQISPYFIFNSLNTIEAYTLTNRRREASQFLQIFSKLIRMVLENSRQELISVEEDLEALKLYVQLEEERYDHVFKTEYDIDPAVLNNKSQIPPLLIQPFVEDAILYSLGNLDEKNGILKITLKSEAPLLRVIIEDNGIALEADAKIDEEYLTQNKSMNMIVARKRVEALGHLYESNTSCEITEIKTGTRVELLLPLLDA